MFSNILFDSFFITMKNITNKTLLALFSFMALSACKKDKNSTDPTPTNTPLFREASLEYIANTPDKVTFFTLDEATNPYVFTWDKAEEKHSIIHFGLKSGVYLVAPHDPFASLFFSDANYGVFFWPQPKKGLTFDSGAVNDINFDTITKSEIDEKVPNAGFGGNNVTNIQIQQGKLIRFVFIDSNNVLKYKGYIKVTAAVDANPTTATLQVKYIAK